MHRNYRQTNLFESTRPKSGSERYLHDNANIDYQLDTNETVYVSRNDLFSTDRGLVAKDVAEKGYQSSNINSRTVRIAERNFLSHSEFPDIQTAFSLSEKNQTENANSGMGSTRRYSSNKVAKFKPFDPNNAPAHFQNNTKNFNSQNFQNYNTSVVSTAQYYPEQGGTIYHYIPPQDFGQVQGTHQNIAVIGTNFHMPMPHLGSSATAVAPNGERIFIPLDHSKYEIRRDNHDLYDMQQNCELHPLSSEGEFESSVYRLHSPRPIDIKGSLSDDWSTSSDGGHETETESEREAESTETDESELASRYVADVLKSITQSVENLKVKGSVEPVVENYRTADCENASENNDDEPGMSATIEKKQTEINDILEIVEENKQTKGRKCVGNENAEENKESDYKDINSIDTVPEKSNAYVADIYDGQTVTSTRFVAEDIIAKKAKFDVKSENQNHEPSTNLVNCDPEDVKLNKRLKSKKTRTWKENRKEKRDREKGKINTVEKENTTSDRHITENEAKETQNIDQENKEKIASNEQSNNVQSVQENHETVIVDGEVYFPASQIENGQYQTYYIPGNYTFVPSPYQQYQSSMDPAYTMFVHDAYPPPSQEEVYTQVHKSLSGELINLTSSAGYHPQNHDENKTQQQLHECAPMSSGKYGNNTATEKIHCDTELNSHLPINNTYQAPENASLVYTPCSNEQYVCQNQFYSDTVNETAEAQPQDQGQLFVCYDEDSVYVDPESGLSFPALHMTEDYLITVILREGIFLEITANKALRLVNHEKKLVVAISDDGNKVCVIHPATRIYQSDTSVHAELYLGRRAKMTDELVMFGNKLKTYKFDHRVVTEMTEEPIFRDLSHDESVDFLSTECGTGNVEMKLKMDEILAHAYFRRNGVRGSTVIINGTKVVQNEKGEVSVYCGPIRFLRMNPEKMILRLKTHLIEIDIETNWNVKITRGPHALNASHIGFIVCNGKIKACLDTNNKFHSFSMPDHRALMLGQPVARHRPGVPVRQRRSLPNRQMEPEGDHWGYVRRNQDEEHSEIFREWEEGWANDFDQSNINYHRRWDPQAGRWVYPCRHLYGHEHR